MTTFLPVAPPRILALLEEAGVMPDGALVIAPLVANDAFRYQAVFDRMRANRPDRDFRVINDNGVIETGYAAPAGVMAGTSVMIRAQVIVLPDVIGDARKTYQASKESVTFYRNPWEFMGVAQGQNLKEFVGCAKKLAEFCTLLAVPRHSVELIGSRIPIIKAVYEETGRPIHLLGFSDNLEDDIASAHEEGVTSIDSAVPIWLGQAAHVIDNPGEPWRQMKRSPYYWTTDEQIWRDEVAYNVAKVVEWLSDGTQYVAKGVPTQAEHAGQGDRSTAPSSSSEKPPARTRSGQVSRS